MKAKPTKFWGNICSIGIMFALCLSMIEAASLVSVTFASNPSLTGKIAFSSDREGIWEIYVMNADGSNQTQLTTNTTNTSPAWSKDGAKIVFQSHRDGNGEIYVMNADGSEQMRLTNNLATDTNSAWSPDDNSIVFVSDRDIIYYEIYKMNADGTGQIRLTNNNAIDCFPSWSPDGSRIVFQSRDFNSENWEIYTMNTDGSGVMRLTNISFPDAYPAWSPDGTKIAFTSERDGEGNLEIYVMNSDGTNQMRLTNNPANDYWPNWSPDGDSIAFTSNRDGNWEIYVMNSDGTNQMRLTNNPAQDDWSSWVAGSWMAPTVSTLDADDVTTTSANMNGDLTWLGSASTVNVFFQLGTSSGNYTSETTAQVKTATGTFTANLSGLNQLTTTYYYRAKAVGHGTSYGDEKSFTTLPQFTLTMAINGNGSTNPAAGPHIYQSGTEVNITSYPAAGWQFAGWTGDVANSWYKNTSVTMNSDKTVVANFKPIPVPSLIAIQITPVNPKVITGTSLQFSAMGIYSNGSRANLTTSVTWASSNPSVFTINANTGWASPVAAGTTVITATYGGVTGSTALTLTPATLQSITITPANPTVARGVAQQFTATGSYSDGSTANLTSSVEWTSSDQTRATIAAHTGLAQALAEGQTTITATLYAVTGSIAMTVITPAPVVVTIGAIKQNPTAYEGQNVRISGSYRGWGAGYGKAPVGRNDFVVEDATGFIYITGNSMGLRYPQDVGKSVALSGTVRIKNSVSYIEVR